VVPATARGCRAVRRGVKVPTDVRLPDAEGFIVLEWHAALADAEADDRDHHLIVCAGAAVSGHPKGVSYRRGHELIGAPDELGRP
jgi:hypothetical protein